MRAVYESVALEDDVLYGRSWVFTNVENQRAFVSSKTQFKTFAREAVRLGSGQRDFRPGGQPSNSTSSFLPLRS
jgi:hypothetical protein